LEQIRCVLFWPLVFCSRCVLPLMPQGCITPNSDMSAFATAWLRSRVSSLRRSGSTTPRATTIHRSGAAARPDTTLAACASQASEPMQRRVATSALIYPDGLRSTDSAACRMRVKSNLLSPIRLICPVSPARKKYFCFPEFFACHLTQITSKSPPSRPTQRGVAQRHGRGSGKRWTRRRCWTHSAKADERKRVVLMPQGWRQVGG
jgi:hypothetical protein